MNKIVKIVAGVVGVIAIFFLVRIIGAGDDAIEALTHLVQHVLAFEPIQGVAGGLIGLAFCAGTDTIKFSRDQSSA